MGIFGFGNKAKLAGEGVKAAGEGLEAAGNGVNTVLGGLRNLITGELPADTIAALKELEVKALEIQQTIQKGQQEIEVAAINKGGFNSFFLAGWRPMLGWISALSIFAYYVPPIILQTIFWIKQSLASDALISFPSNFDMAEIMGLVGSLLGMGILRTIEKNQGSQDNH